MGLHIEGCLGKKIMATVAVAFCAGSFVLAVAQGEVNGRPPLNTELEVETASFSKQNFVLSLQKVLQSEGTEQALALYSGLPSEYEKDSELLVIKASLLISAQKFSQAKTICTDIRSREPENMDALELLLYIAKLEGDTRTQSTLLKSILAKDQYNVTANIELAENAFDNKNYKQAYLYYQKALVRDKDNENVLFGLGQTEYYLGAKDPSMDSKAEATFKLILEKNPSNSLAYSYLGKIAAASSKYKTATGYIQKAIELENDNYNYFLDYGMYERQLGHFSTAEQAWGQAIALQPDYFLAYAYRGGLYDETDRISEALKDYENVIRCNPDYYYAYESIGVLAVHQKQWDKARAAFEKCYEMDKTNNISYPLMITYCYYMAGDRQGAKKFSDKVLRTLDRKSIDYAMLRVWHDEAGEMPLPQKINALDNSNKKGKMWFYLGLLYDRVGGSEFASENFSKVVQMNSPMIFEYRMAEWKLGMNTDLSKAD